jgi:hypothetical protein
LRLTLVSLSQRIVKQHAPVLMSVPLYEFCVSKIMCSIRSVTHLTAWSDRVFLC